MSLFTEDPFDEGVENEEMPTAKRPRDETDVAEEGDEPVASKPRLEEDTPSADPTPAVVEMHPEEDATNQDCAVDLVHQKESTEQEQNITAPGQEEQEEDFTTLDQEEAALDEASHQQTMSEAIAAASVAAANHQSSLEAFEAAKRQWDVERQTQRVAMEALLAENKSLRSTASKADGSATTSAAAAAAVASEMDLESRRWLVLAIESAERRQVEAERKAAQQTLLCQVATRNAQVWKQVASAAAASSLSPPNSFLTTAATTTSCAVAEDGTSVHNSNSNHKNMIVDRLRTVLREGTKRAIQRLQERDELIDPPAKEMIRSSDAEVVSEAPETAVAAPSVSLSEKREALVSFIQFLCDQAVAACDARCALQEQNRILGMENERMNELLVQIAQHSAEPRLVLLHQASQRHVQLAAPSVEELEESRERRRLQQRVSVLEAVLASQLPPHGLSNATAVVPHVLAEQLSTSDRLQRELEGARSENAYLRRLIVDHHQAALVEASNQSPLSAPSGASAPSTSLDTLLINACRRWSHAARVSVDVLFQQQQQSAPLELLTEGKYRAYEAQVTILNRALADLTAENVSLRNAQSVARASIDVLRRSLSAVAWDGESARVALEKAVELMDPLTRSPSDNQGQPTSVVVEGAIASLRDVLAHHLQQVSEVFQRREVQHLRVQQALTALLQSAHEALYETFTATRGDGAQEGVGKALPPVLPSFRSTPYRVAADLFTITIQSSASSPLSANTIEEEVDRNTTTKAAMEALEKSFEQELQKLRSRLEWYRSHRGYQGAKQLEESQSTLTVTLAKLKECDARLSKLTRTEEELNLTKLLVETQKKRIDSLESQLKVSQESLSKSRAEQTRTGKALDEKTAEAQSLAQKAARFESMEKEANTYRLQLEEANELVSRLMRAEEERQQVQRQQQEAVEQLSNTADGEGLPQDDAVNNEPQENAEGGESLDEQLQQDYEEAEGEPVGEQEEVVEEEGGGDTVAEDFEELDEGATPFDGEEVEAEADTENEAPATAVTEESAIEPQSETDVDPSVVPEEGEPNTTLVASSVLQQADEDFGDSDEEDLNNANGTNPETAE